MTATVGITVGGCRTTALLDTGAGINVTCRQAIQSTGATVSGEGAQLEDSTGRPVGDVGSAQLPLSIGRTVVHVARASRG